jgi:4-amino-4-deoxy-L-arabinose transferase-like glycosyltransferase
MTRANDEANGGGPTLDRPGDGQGADPPAAPSAEGRQREEPANAELRPTSKEPANAELRPTSKEPANAEPRSPSKGPANADPRPTSKEPANAEPRPTSKRPTRLLAFGIAALVLFPFLAQSGIWDPYELDTADLARRIAVQVFRATGLALPNATNSLPTLSDLKMGELPFTSMALGFKIFGLHDWTGRLPLAVWAFVGVVVLHEFLARLVDRRAGLYGAIALVTMPLYFMQARTMLGDIVTMVSLTLGFCGLAGAMLDDAAPRKLRPRLGWLSVGIVGLVAGYLSRGLIIGVAVPALGVGLSWAVIRGAGEGRGTPARDVFGALTLALGAAALGLGWIALLRAPPDLPLSRAIGFALLKKAPTDSTFDLTFQKLGHSLFPWSAFLPFAFGRLFRAPVYEGGALLPPGAVERETHVRVALLVGASVAYGAFALVAPYAGAIPFAAPALLAGIAAIAVLDYERGAPPSRALALGCLVIGIVLYADIVREPEKAMSVFVVDRPQFPKSFEVEGGRRMLVVLAAFAGLIGLTWFEAQPRAPSEPPRVWARGMLDTYRQGLVDLSAIWNGNLLFGLVIVEAALIGLGSMIFVGKRAGWGPVDKLPKNFVDLGLNVWWVAPLAVAAAPPLLFLIRDAFRWLVERTRASRASFTLIAALIAGAVQSFWYYPALAAQLSPKEVFDAYARLHVDREPLALLGVRERAVAYYSGGEVESFAEVNRAFAWLTERMDQRRWMVVKADDLPRLNSLFRTLAARNIPVLDGRSSQILLVSNQLGGRENESWISKMVLDEKPSPVVPIDIAFEDQLEAFGWEVRDKSGRVVDSVVPAKTYHLRVYYRVLRSISGNWKAFVHIDGFQRRFNGDHNALDGKYPMNLWQAGDVIVDDLAFQLEPNFTPGDYTVFFGFFSGETRLRVMRGPSQDNRGVAGVIHVR